MVTLKITAIGAIASGKSAALMMIVAAFANQPTFKNVKHKMDPVNHTLTITAELATPWDKPK